MFWLTTQMVQHYTHEDQQGRLQWLKYQRHGQNCRVSNQTTTTFGPDLQIWERFKGEIKTLILFTNISLVYGIKEEFLESPKEADLERERKP